MKTKLIAIVLSGALLFSSVILSGCSAPTPEADLLAAVATLDIVSALPNLTPADRAWVATAAIGLSCSSTVLAKGEPAAQESVDITQCFAMLPVIPAADQPYIAAGIAAVEVFVSLFEPVPTPVAVAANARIRGMNLSGRAKAVAGVQARTAAIRARVIAH